MMADRDYGKGRKFAHEEVDYGEGLPQAHCGICEHFHENRPRERCDLVVDPIDADKWCKKFHRRK